MNMNQEVNFLRALPQKSHILPATHIALANLALLVLCTLVSLYLGIQQFLVNIDYRRAQEAHAQATAQYQDLIKKNPLLATDKPLVTLVTDFEKNLREKQAHFAKLSHATSRRPFSKFMKTLSVTVPEGLWLTEINIDQDAEDISLKGYSLRPIFVSVFLEELQKSTVFTGIVFDLFYVKKIKDKNYIQFEIANDNLSSYTAPKPATNQDNQEKKE
jgi:Tfp pilus assembly protein PilN